MPDTRITASVPKDAQVSLCLLTGFLGAGKTTLLGRLLAEPGMAATAVIINEFGEAGLDHLLVREIAPDVVQLPNGCLCCAVRRDLVTSFRDLVAARDAGQIPWFDRAVVETSGLADPAPILSTLSADPFLDQLIALDSVVTVADPALVTGQTRNYAEAAAQVALADLILLSRTDIAEAPAGVWLELGVLNPVADILDAQGEQALASLLFGRTRRSRAVRPLAPGRHAHGLTTLTLEMPDDLTRFGFARALAGLAQARGDDILRIKGLLRFADVPGRVAAVHAVQHTMFPPDWLINWPDADPRGRLVVIGRDLDLNDLLNTFPGAAPWADVRIAAE